MTAAEIVTAGRTPVELADVANREHELARAAGESMLEHACRSGEEKQL
jgi:hypothetical protein